MYAAALGLTLLAVVFARIAEQRATARGDGRGDSGGGGGRHAASEGGDGGSTGGGRSTAGSASAAAAGEARFRTNYLTVYLMAMAADWLQGPYVYALYASYGFERSSIARLYIIGFAASAVGGTALSSAADVYGRKRAVLLYCAIYAGSCATKHVGRFAVLAAGRVLGGVAYSLLFAAPEAWMVSAHRTRGYPPAGLGRLFGAAAFGNGVVAIVAGGVGALAVAAWGAVAPFDVAAAVLAVCGTVVALTWEENYGGSGGGVDGGGGGSGGGSGDGYARSVSWDAGGDAKRRAPTSTSRACLGSVRASMLAVSSSLRQAVGAARRDERVLLLGTIQSAFEGALYTFTFLWTPALEEAAAAAAAAAVPPGGGPPPTPPGLPHGLVFSSFMAATMVGSSLFGILTAASPAGVGELPTGEGVGLPPSNPLVVGDPGATGGCCTSVATAASEGSIGSTGPPSSASAWGTPTGAAPLSPSSGTATTVRGTATGAAARAASAAGASSPPPAASSPTSLPAANHGSWASGLLRRLGRGRLWPLRPPLSASVATSPSPPTAPRRRRAPLPVGILLLGVVVATAALFAGLSTRPSPSPATVYAVFLAFELAVGVYLPALSTLRAPLVPDASRAALLTYFRLPLNGIVVAALAADLSVRTVVAVCAVLLAVAGGAMARLAHLEGLLGGKGGRSRRSIV